MSNILPHFSNLQSLRAGTFAQTQTSYYPANQTGRCVRLIRIG